MWVRVRVRVRVRVGVRVRIRLRVGVRAPDEVACLVCSERHVGRWMDCANCGRCSTTCSGRVRTRIRRSLPTEKRSTDCRKTQPPRT